MLVWLQVEINESPYIGDQDQYVDDCEKEWRDTEPEYDVTVAVVTEVCRQETQGPCQEDHKADDNHSGFR